MMGSPTFYLSTWRYLWQHGGMSGILAPISQYEGIYGNMMRYLASWLLSLNTRVSMTPRWDVWYTGSYLSIWGYLWQHDGMSGILAPISQYEGIYGTMMGCLASWFPSLNKRVSMATWCGVWYPGSYLSIRGYLWHHDGMYGILAPIYQQSYISLSGCLWHHVIISYIILPLFLTMRVSMGSWWDISIREIFNIRYVPCQALFPH